ncbi:putative Exocyst complex component 6B-like 2 [Homarus americanus]|uniref:Putative Exocyst complex component 6B-like 2 n=1 Tax=Homarus americanus TaxID=6706 RepID=A0A8J5N9W1_HOMAM|nr:putative Exocyst complex component 6B-like 2 [Homarus americanus]
MEVTVQEDTARTSDSSNKGPETGEEDPVALRHELLLREIEAIDEYWGPTFRHWYIQCDTSFSPGHQRLAPDHYFLTPPFLQEIRLV